MNVIKMTNLRLSKMNYADIKEEYEAVIEIPEEKCFENQFKDMSYEEFYNIASLKVQQKMVLT